MCGGIGDAAPRAGLRWSELSGDAPRREQAWQRSRGQDDASEWPPRGTGTLTSCFWPGFGRGEVALCDTGPSGHTPATFSGGADLITRALGKQGLVPRVAEETPQRGGCGFARKVQVALGAGSRQGAGCAAASGNLIRCGDRFPRSLPARPHPGDPCVSQAGLPGHSAEATGVQLSAAGLENCHAAGPG